MVLPGGFLRVEEEGYFQIIFLVYFVCWMFCLDSCGLFGGPHSCVLVGHAVWSFFHSFFQDSLCCQHVQFFLFTSCWINLLLLLSSIVPWNMHNFWIIYLELKFVYPMIALWYVGVVSVGWCGYLFLLFRDGIPVVYSGFKYRWPTKYRICGPYVYRNYTIKKFKFT